MAEKKPDRPAETANVSPFGQSPPDDELAHIRHQKDLILEAAGEGIYGLDREGNTTFVNPAAAGMLGWDAEALIGKPMHALHHHTRPDGTPYTKEECPIYAAFKDGVTHRVDDDVFWRRDGRSFPVEYTSTPIHENGALAGAVVVFRDITERKQSRATIEHLMRQNELILAAAGEGIYGIALDGLASFTNPAAVAMTGWAPGDIIGKPTHDLHHHTKADGSPYPREECPIYATLHDGRVHHCDDEVFWRKDGSSFPVEYTSTPIVENGRLAGAVVVFKDISERKRAEGDLRRAYVDVALMKERLEAENVYLQEEIKVSQNFAGIVGGSHAIKQVLRQIELVAPTDASVLITGESGTGKELIACAIHEQSQRNERPLIRVNCAAIPRDLFESEFFGHVKGAFTGAVRDRSGRFELADGGTIFLDEVGEIPLDQQGKLLRVLQEGQIERVGEERTRSIDVRVIAATNRDLRADVDARRFREDLYFRLNVFPVEAVPLRGRIDDIPLLAAHFITLICRRLNRPDPPLTQANVKQLQSYHWPGNIRELQNIIERAIIVSSGNRLQFSLPGTGPDTGVDKTISTPEAVQTVPYNESERLARDRANILAALRLTEGRVSGTNGAAELLGIKPTTLASRMKALGVAKAIAGK
ncbi:MAG: sigma 54-interacting transcriptional regulator [Pseudomonadota bacterium]|nr:sigma 54-interacting transcriptional regulator [Pseudomonadota bacterium]